MQPNPESYLIRLPHDCFQNAATPSTMTWVVALSRPVQGSRMKWDQVPRCCGALLWDLQNREGDPVQRATRCPGMATECSLPAVARNFGEGVRGRVGAGRREPLRFGPRVHGEHSCEHDRLQRARSLCMSLRTQRGWCSRLWTGCRSSSTPPKCCPSIRRGVLCSMRSRCLAERAHHLGGHGDQHYSFGGHGW